MESTIYTNIGDGKVNEDYAGSRQCSGFYAYALADGLGGHGDGDVASRAAVEAVLETAAGAQSMTAGLLERCIKAAQQSVLERQAAAGRRSSMKTTLVVLLTDGKTAMWGHVGDSRLYLCRGGKVKKRTCDHSVPQMLVNSGKIKESQIRHHEDRSLLLRALGDTELETGRWAIDCAGISLSARDAFVLCTDGMWEWLEDSRIADYAGSAAPVDIIGGQMFAEARSAAGSARMDNCTVLIARFANAAARQNTGVLSRIRQWVSSLADGAVFGRSAGK